jgi:hypothetical protein
MLVLQHIAHLGGVCRANRQKAEHQRRPAEDAGSVGNCHAIVLFLSLNDASSDGAIQITER